MVLIFTIKENYNIFNPITRRTEKEFGNLSDKQRRSFSRLASGIKKSIQKGYILRFYTLTTSTRPRPLKRNGKTRSLNDAFNLFKMRIERATIKKDGFRGFKFSRYFKIETYEGNGVLHVVYHGTKKHYIPKGWITKTWSEIWNSEVNDIRLVKNPNGITRYLVANYLMKNPIKRMSCGWGWLWRGFCASWKKIKDVYAFGGERRHIGSIKNAITALHSTFWIKPPRTKQLYLYKPKKL